MSIKQEVIIDLLPLYFEGNASEETVELVENYFEENPDFAKSMNGMYRNLKSSYEHRLNKSIAVDSNPEEKMRILKRTQQLLRWRSGLFIAGMTGIIVPLIMSTFAQPEWISRGFIFSWFVMTPMIWAGYGFIRYRMRTSGRWS